MSTVHGGLLLLYCTRGGFMNSRMKIYQKNSYCRAQVPHVCTRLFKLFLRGIKRVVWRRSAELVSALEATFNSTLRRVSWGFSEKAPPRTGGVQGVSCQVFLALSWKIPAKNHYGWRKQEENHFARPLRSRGLGKSAFWISSRSFSPTQLDQVGRRDINYVLNICSIPESSSTYQNIRKGDRKRRRR